MGHVGPASPDVITTYAVELAYRPLSVATIDRWLAAIGRMHGRPSRTRRPPETWPCRR